MPEPHHSTQQQDITRRCDLKPLTSSSSISFLSPWLHKRIIVSREGKHSCCLLNTGICTGNTAITVTRWICIARAHTHTHKHTHTKFSPNFHPIFNFRIVFTQCSPNFHTATTDVLCMKQNVQTRSNDWDYHPGRNTFSLPWYTHSFHIHTHTHKIYFRLKPSMYEPTTPCYTNCSI